MLLEKLESKRNVWYLDDVNLANDYEIMLRDIKIIL